jgi:hypothetical protein
MSFEINSLLAWKMFMKHALDIAVLLYTFLSLCKVLSNCGKVVQPEQIKVGRFATKLQTWYALSIAVPPIP